MELDSYLPYLVNRLGQRFVSEFTPSLAEAGIDVQMWRALSVLHRHGDLPASALSELTSINLSTLSRLVGRMDAKGLVLRRRDGADSRTVNVRLTPEGKRATEELIPKAVALEARATAGLSRSEIETLRRLLPRLYASLAATGAAAA